MKWFNPYVFYRDKKFFIRAIEEDGRKNIYLDGGHYYRDYYSIALNPGLSGKPFELFRTLLHEFIHYLIHICKLSPRFDDYLDNLLSGPREPIHICTKKKEERNCLECEYFNS